MESRRVIRNVQCDEYKWYLLCCHAGVRWNSHVHIHYHIFMLIKTDYLVEWKEILQFERRVSNGFKEENEISLHCDALFFETIFILI